jgi:hypothetical protein
MKTYIIKKDTYESTVTVERCYRPTELTHVKFNHTSFKEDGSILQESNYEMFLSDAQLTILSQALAHIPEYA